MILEPGWTANVAVHRHVMKCKLPSCNITDDSGVWVDYDYVDAKAIPPYSTDFTAAMEVVALMEKDGGSVHLISYDGRHRECTVYSDHWAGRVHADAETLPLAIVKAGLLWALELKEREEADAETTAN